MPTPRIALAAILLLLLGALSFAQDPAAAPAQSLRALGAVGDGTTDDREALQAAFNAAKGAPLDGEGLTYAVRGNIEVTTHLDLRNATFLQTMDPPDTARFLLGARGEGGEATIEPPDALRSTVGIYPVLHPEGTMVYANDPVPTGDELKALMPGIALRTLAIYGKEDAPVSVRLDNVKVDRGRHPQSGGRNDGAGIDIGLASPVHLRDVTITGDGKGKGLGLTDCTNVRIQRLRIHDMTWAPYDGDPVLEQIDAAQARDDFGWNNFPIYEWRQPMGRFARVRIQEQIAGMFVLRCDNVEIVESSIERIGTRIKGDFFAIQADGITLNRTNNIVVRDCRFEFTWEAIDFTGGWGSNFLFENCVTVDSFSFGYKLAHPKQNGRMINCVAERSGIAGFTIGGKSENILLVDCKALENGYPPYWARPDGTRLSSCAGFRIEAGESGSPLPLNIRLDGCAAINDQHPDAMEHGIACEPDPARHNISLGAFEARGATIAATRGITPSE